MRHMMLAWLIAGALAPVALGAGDLTAQQWIEVGLELGSVHDHRAAGHRMVFTPAELTFETGKYYELAIHNGDSITHEFVAPEFFASVYVKDVKVYTADGRLLAEIGGQFSEIEVAPGGRVGIFFVPVRIADAAEMVCDIPEHRQAGMVGKIRIR